MIFAILFGLSMDYEVFLVSRIYEEWHQRGDNREAITHGLAATGRTITAAAAIMVLVFARVRPRRRARHQAVRRRRWRRGPARRADRPQRPRPRADAAGRPVELVAAALARPAPAPERRGQRGGRGRRAAHSPPSGAARHRNGRGRRLAIARVPTLDSELARPAAPVADRDHHESVLTCRIVIPSAVVTPWCPLPGVASSPFWGMVLDRSRTSNKGRRPLALPRERGPARAGRSR